MSAGSSPVLHPTLSYELPDPGEPRFRRVNMTTTAEYRRNRRIALWITAIVMSVAMVTVSLAIFFG